MPLPPSAVMRLRGPKFAARILLSACTAALARQLGLSASYSIRYQRTRPFWHYNGDHKSWFSGQLRAHHLSIARPDDLRAHMAVTTTGKTNPRISRRSILTAL
ncbi:hypothetical protein B0T19DRAFT_430411 [Cercophora scortea]|uniref:Uncharacterized protein n=1 Tax=Cercophora scortea TaxID=314031 RepID=A0AAE0I9E7_9PEZI|nr:hypothetical protein B0T19DRAFT_430411 [Cercophora scortea]